MVAATGLAVAVAGPAAATPGGTGDDGEGGSKSLISQLDAASRGYLDAKAALAAGHKRQADLNAQLKQLDAEVGPKQAAFDQIVQQAYKTGRLGPMSALINADSPAGILDRADGY